MVWGRLDTIYETDNGLELDDDGYEEYYACAIEVLSILSNSDGKNFRVGQLIEISSKEPHLCKVRLENGEIVWELGE